ncbi:MAG: flagellar basal body P-ring formation chaperone FlgA [Candidatus Marinimicrobia bacterium]|nr:flagellar basal body P-ring formation chaperone FlgA [Candidatus Neomarinimicrobiota bacterium]
MIPLLLQATDTRNAQAKLVAEYFAKRLDITRDHIEVELIHISNINKTYLQNGQIQVQSGQRKFNLGHQTLWMVHKVNGVVRKKYPITVEVHANLMVPTALKNVSRLEILSKDLVLVERRRIGREYCRVLADADQVYTKMATQMIREGRIIERNMVRVPPDVLRGAEVQIVLNNDGLRLELAGIAKDEGLIGEEIRVQCPATRKEFRGILESPKQVSVSLR